MTGEQTQNRYTECEPQAPHRQPMYHSRQHHGFSGKHVATTNGPPRPAASRVTAQAAPQRESTRARAEGWSGGQSDVLTRMWTGACGFTSLKARHWSSSWTTSAGISLRMILETGASRTRHHPSRSQSGESNSGFGHRFSPADDTQAAPQQPTNQGHGVAGGAHARTHKIATKRGPVRR